MKQNMNSTFTAQTIIKLISEKHNGQIDSEFERDGCFRTLFGDYCVSIYVYEHIIQVEVYNFANDETYSCEFDTQSETYTNMRVFEYIESVIGV